MTVKSERRRIRRGRQPSVQQSQGHGKRTYVPVRQTNFSPTFKQRHVRQPHSDKTSVRDLLTYLKEMGL